jgi:hypothetical protein
MYVMSARSLLAFITFDLSSPDIQLHTIKGATKLVEILEFEDF